MVQEYQKKTPNMHICGFDSAPQQSKLGPEYIKYMWGVLSQLRLRAVNTGFSFQIVYFMNRCGCNYTRL